MNLKIVLSAITFLIGLGLIAFVGLTADKYEPTNLNWVLMVTGGILSITSGVYIIDKAVNM